MQVMCLCLRLGLLKEGKVEVLKLVGQLLLKGVMVYNPPSENPTDVT